MKTKKGNPRSGNPAVRDKGLKKAPSSSGRPLIQNLVALSVFALASIGSFLLIHGDPRNPMEPKAGVSPLVGDIFMAAAIGVGLLIIFMTLVNEILFYTRDRKKNSELKLLGKSGMIVLVLLLAIALLSPVLLQLANSNLTTDEVDSSQVTEGL